MSGRALWKRATPRPAEQVKENMNQNIPQTMKNNLDETPTGPLKRVLSKLMQVTSIKRKKRKRKPISQGCSLGSEQLGGGRALWMSSGIHRHQGKMQRPELLQVTGRGRVTQPQREPELQKTSLGKPACQCTMWLQRNQARFIWVTALAQGKQGTGSADIVKEGVALLI